METPPVRGFSYTTEFHNAYTRVATRFRLPLVPLFLYGVIGKPELNLTDGIHPNAAGHALIAEAIWTHLGPRLVR
jgi:acyl-CoA thioesterase I